LGRVEADAGQIEQVIMNLAVNARDAMPQGGKLQLEMMNVNLDEVFARAHFPIAAGPFVMLSVGDTGCGIDAATQARMFEPFFTTKEKGKGTGLGLATVYGIVKQSGGFIWVDSKLGRGTTFNLYFPRVNELTAAREPVITPAVVRFGGDTILVVEDEEALRLLVCMVLRAKNYTVIEGASGDEALLASDGYRGPIHLLITDVVMPSMKGTELAKRLRVLRPQTKVLYISGYTDRAFDELGEFKSGSAFLQKPFTPQVLANKVQEILGSPLSANGIAA
jgi:CheY-like chemotaxis protein